MEELIIEEELMRLNKSQEITNSEVSQTSPDAFTNRLFETALLLDKYYTPLLCLFGAFGNSLSLAVFCLDAKYGSQSSSYYLSALAVSDTGFLLNVFAVWLEGFYGGVITTDLSCPLVMYLGQVTCFMSVYFTVAFSIERFVAVHYPFSRPRICTRSKAKKLIAGITVLALLLFSYAWIIAKVVSLPLSEPTTTPTSDPEKQLGHYKNFRPSTFPDVLLSPTATPTEPVVLAKYTMSPHSNPHYKDQKSQSWFFDNDYQNENAEWMDDSSGRVDNQVEDPQGRRHFKWEAGDLNPFPSSSSTRNDTNSPTLYLNVNRQAVMNNNGSTGINGRCKICTVPEMYHKISEIANYIDSILTLVLPFFFIAFFNLRIAMTVWKLKDQRRNIVARAPSSTSLCRENSYQDNQRRRSTIVCNNVENGSLLFCTPSNHRKICCLVNIRNSKNQVPANDSNSDRGTVRFHDNIEMSHIESTGQGSSSLLVSHNLIQSAVTPTPITTPNNPTSSPRFCVVRRKKPTSSEVRVTKTLLLVSLVFILLNLPAHAIRCAQFIQTLTGTRKGQEILYALQPWANILFNTNFAVNFLLYCVSGRNFRNSLKNIFMRKCQCRHPARNMAPRFSWASDRSNKKRNSCGPTTAATASTLVPSSATLAEAAAEDSTLLKTTRKDYSKIFISTGGGQVANGLCSGAHPDKNCESDDDESEGKEENTTKFLAYCSHDSYLNYYDEDQDDLNDGNLEEVAAV